MIEITKVVALTVALLVGVCISVGATGGTKTANVRNVVSTQAITKPVKEKESCNKWKIVKAIRFYRATAWQYDWQREAPLSRFTKWRPSHSCAFLGYLALSARKKARISRRAFNEWYKAMYSRWGCIHSYEGAWNDPNGPFYGGLQMDLGFQRSYGPEFLRRWGTADHWPVWAQLLAAERARRSGRGYYPWPNTARYCGLI